MKKRGSPPSEESAALRKQVSLLVAAKVVSDGLHFRRSDLLPKITAMGVTERSAFRMLRDAVDIESKMRDRAAWQNTLRESNIGIGDFAKIRWILVDGARWLSLSDIEKATGWKIESGDLPAFASKLETIESSRGAQRLRFASPEALVSAMARIRSPYAVVLRDRLAAKLRRAAAERPAAVPSPSATTSPTKDTTMPKPAAVDAARRKQKPEVAVVGQTEPAARADLSALIPIGEETIGGALVQTVDARKLWAGLGIAKKFADWIKAQIERADLRDGMDFVVEFGVPEKGSQTGRGGNRLETKEYFLTLRAAKHVAMMSGGARGEEVRDYFIRCEEMAKAALATPPAPVNAAAVLEDPAQLRALLLGYAERVIGLQQQCGRLAEEKAEVSARLEAAQPAVQAVARIAASVGDECIRETAKILGLAPKVLRDWLLANGWIYRSDRNQRLVAYQSKVKAGLLVVRETSLGTNADGTERTGAQVKVTPAGRLRLAEIVPGAIRPGTGPIRHAGQAEMPL